MNGKAAAGNGTFLFPADIFFPTTINQTSEVDHVHYHDAENCSARLFWRPKQMAKSSRKNS